MLQRAYQPGADALNFGAVALGDLPQAFIFNEHLGGQQCGPVPSVRQAMAVRVAARKHRASASVQAAAAVPRTALAPASSVTSRQRLGSARNSAGQVVGKAHVREIAGCQVFLKRAVRKGVDPNPTRLQQPGTVAQVFDEARRP